MCASRARRTWPKNNNNGGKSTMEHGRRAADVESSISSDVTSDRSDSKTVTCFEISFHRDSAKYYEAEQISGMVILNLLDDVVIENLTIDFSGIAMVEWMNKPRDKQGNISIDTEKHLNQVAILYSRAQSSSSDLLVPAGHHEYPFQIQLPFSLPSSFVADHGSVRYRAKAVLERPWQTGAVTEREFTISSVLDLNAFPQVMNPVHCHKSSLRRRGCCGSCLPALCSHNKFVMIWRLDRTGFVPGERIRINGEIHNDGKTLIRKSMSLLIQHVQYVDIWGHNTTERKEVALLKKGPIHGGHIEFWREDMEVPPLPPTALKGCNLMNLWYTLKLKVLPSGLSKPLETSIEITIGTVPLARNNSGAIAVLSSPYIRGIGGSATSLDPSEDYNYFV